MFGPAASPGMRLFPPWMSPPKVGHPLIMNYMQPTSVCGPGFCYGMGSGRGWCRFLSGGWSLLSSIGYWVIRKLAVVGGGGGSVPATWRQLSVADPYEGGAVGRLVFPGCIGYSTV